MNVCGRGCGCALCREVHFEPKDPFPSYPAQGPNNRTKEKRFQGKEKPPLRTSDFPAPETPNSFKVSWSPWVLRRWWWRQVGPGRVRGCGPPFPSRNGAVRGPCACGSALAQPRLHLGSPDSALVSQSLVEDSK